MIIAGHRIRAVSGLDSVPLPPGARVIDARGKYLIPGLWDLHTHPHLYADYTDLVYPLFLANGVTGIRDAAAYDLPLEGRPRCGRGR